VRPAPLASRIARLERRVRPVAPDISGEVREALRGDRQSATLQKDRFEIEALRGEFTDAVMMRDYDRFASLFTHDGAWRIPYAKVELVSREEIRAGIERGQGLWEYFVQNTHPGTIQLEGDTAVGRAYIQEFGHMRDGSSQLHYSLYHDRYQRTPDGWKFTERVYEISYLDTTPVAGSAPHTAGGAR
jgi:ketosteroid isomerase-like protein